MSAHCSRYPSCGCGEEIGTKCHLQPDDPRLKEKEVEVIERDENGFPLLPNGFVDWDKASEEKALHMDDIGGHRSKYASGYTKPKKNRRKINSKKRKQRKRNGK